MALPKHEITNKNNLKTHMKKKIITSTISVAN